MGQYLHPQLVYKEFGMRKSSLEQEWNLLKLEQTPQKLGENDTPLASYNYYA